MLAVDSQKVKTNAAGALGSLAHNRLNQRAICEEGGVQALIKILSEGGREATTAQGEAAVAIAGMVGDSQIQEQVREEGGIQVLIKALRVDNPKVKANAASALGFLAQNCQNQAVIREHGGIKALNKVRREGSQEAQEIAAAALETLQITACTEGMHMAELSRQWLDTFTCGRHLFFIPMVAGGVGVCLSISLAHSWRESIPPESARPLFAC
eukprot:gnl/TRDRNA2_/TRDRNA2_173812_c0_seq3.p1 gnl/TRDRNA2_/TRDRNA2_173812_c0~~gnl/TRDRNA2_/TRDRNA2_173812_c0_seq3.p1  ORF type:complete len:212 (+),score=36.08 gnl/TRDRNA2_/TRDRNA2_173812_c0_seq3:193-828(+)